MTQHLPIYDHEQEIIDAVRNHAVVVVEGPAGTGKTTQLPRMLRRSGLVPRRIGVTQPRRIAAVSVAWRIAAEENCAIGEDVGYAIRFDDATSSRTAIKIMTDGILLQEARGDPELRAYDILMVDEAHERSLNIDFTLGLLHRVLQRRRDIRVVISSATLHPGQFQRFFKDVAGAVPIVSVKTRTFPLDIQYRPLKQHTPDKIVEAVTDHVMELHDGGKEGHVLVFLPGEGLIQKCETSINARNRGRALLPLPLYGRLTREEQERIFQDFGPGRRKVILSTNIAETSITIEGVNFVIDSGLSKLPWYNAHTGVTTLREEPVSQASATQRAGRAGRLGPGTVIRMYSEEAMQGRPEFTPEEIVRVDLSEAVLRLIDLGVRDVESFPFPTPPPPRKLGAALASLQAMGAITEARELTDVGRQMVPFPLSPPLARMVVEAATRFPDVVSDVLLVGAYLSVRSPFTFPPGEEDAARQAQRKLADPLGDSITAVRTYRLWKAASDREAFCKRNFLDADTMTFIHKAHAQLCDIAEQCGVPVREGHGNMENVVRSVATGFADKVLIRRGGFTYETLGELKVALHPSSSLYSSAPRLVVVAELMSSGRTYAFNASALKPEWLNEVNPQAAQRWQLVPRTARGASSRQAGPPQPPQPLHLDIGEVRLQVEPRRRRPVVQVPLSAIAALSQADTRKVPQEQRRWRAKVVSEFGTLMHGSLGFVLAMAPVVPWPTASNKRQKLPPLGALLEPDRNLHAIARFLDDVTVPVPDAAPRPGWLALVSNGGGGYWYEVLAVYTDALYGSVQAVEDLLVAGAATASIGDQLKAVLKRLEKQAATVTTAMAQSD